MIRTEDGYNRTMLYSTVSALLIIVLVLLVVQRSIFSGLNYAIEVLQSLTEARKVEEIERPKTLLSSANDEVGKLIRALGKYKSKLDELSDLRALQSKNRIDRDRLIINKMRTLSNQLEGEAKELLLSDIARMEAMGLDS